MKDCEACSPAPNASSHPSPRKSLSVVPPVHNSVTQTTISIIKCFVGAASFELPGALKNGGLAASLAGVLALCLVSYYTLRMLARCGELLETRRASTYPEIGYAACGNVGWVSAWTGVVFMTLGVCSAYVVFVSSQLEQLLLPTNDFFTRKNCVLLLLPTFVLLSWGPYKYLSHFSVIGISALVFALAVVMYDAFSYNDISPISSYPAFEASTFPLFLGNVSFVYLIHSVVLPMRNAMAKPLFCPKTLGIAIVAVTVLNMAFAVPVYLLYSEGTMGNIIDNLKEGTLKQAVQAALCVDLFFTYALFLFPMAEALENDFRRLRVPHLPHQPALLSSSSAGLASEPLLALSDEKEGGEGGLSSQLLLDGALRRSSALKRGREGEGEGEEGGGTPPLPWVARAAVRAFLVACTVIVAYSVSDFSAVSALSGGFGNNMVGFILPPIFLTLIKYKRGWWRENGVGRMGIALEVGTNAAIAGGGVLLLVSSVKAFISNL